MFSSHKRIFAGKGNLHAEPFCPCITNDTGFFELKRHANTNRRPSGSGGFTQAEPTIRMRKSHA